MPTRADDGSRLDAQHDGVDGEPLERAAREAVRNGVSTLSPDEAAALPRMVTESAEEPPTAQAATPDHKTEHKPDRWHWRRRIRANKHQLFWYRIVIAVLGLLCIGAGVVTGPLPGPGGIPLVLLGLAIWASEFKWAHRLMQWFKRRLHWVRQLPPGRKILFWLAFACCCGLLGYTGLLLFGLPGWLPDIVHDVLGQLPGVRSRG